MASGFDKFMAALANPFGAILGADNSGGTIWNNNGDKYANASASEAANGFVGTGLDPDGLVAGLWNDLTGVTSQSREFAQQDYLLDKEAKLNDPAYRMARMKAAGINPNLAAGGIAGGSMAASAPSVASNVGGVAGAFGAASNALGSISQANLNSSSAKANNAKAALDLATSRNVDRLADAEILSKAGSFAQSLTAAGTPEIAAMELALSTVRGGLDGIAAILKGDGVCRMIDSQQQVIEADFSRQWKEIERLEKDIELQRGRIAEQDYKTQITEIEKKKGDLQLWREQQINELWRRFDGDPYLNEFQLMANIRLKYGEDSTQYQSILSQAKDMMYNQNLGAYNAEADTAFAISQGRRNGENASDLLYARVGSWADAIGRASYLIGGNIQNLQDNIVSAFKSGGVNKQGRAIRKELTMILDNAYEAMDKYPEDSKHYQDVIAEMQAALSLSNKELVEWYNKSNK